MPEVILPCPACGAVENEGDKFALSYRLGTQFICHKCGMYGPVADDFHEAVERWNALPRALRWTYEPPKVAGWYPWRSGKGQNITMIQTHIFNGVCGYWDGNGVFRTDLNRGEWAGPIPAPLEPEES